MSRGIVLASAAWIALSLAMYWLGSSELMARGVAPWKARWNAFVVALFAPVVLLAVFVYAVFIEKGEERDGC